MYLLDGHFCLIDSHYSIKEVPINTYESLGIKEIIFNDEEIILKKLKSRDNKDYSLEFIKRLQQNEISYGKYIADKIKVPIRIIDLSRGEADVESIIKDISNPSKR